MTAVTLLQTPPVHLIRLVILILHQDHRVTLLRVVALPLAVVVVHLLEVVVPLVGKSVVTPIADKEEVDLYVGYIK